MSESNVDSRKEDPVYERTLLTLGQGFAILIQIWWVFLLLQEIGFL